MTAPLLAGVARRDITPPLGTPLMGYPDPKSERRADSVRDPLNATAIAFRQDGRTAVLLELDLGIVEDAHVAAIRSQAAAATGVSPDAITVATIQTHSAPCTQRAWGWCEVDTPYVDGIVIPGAVAAITAACASMLPVRIGIAETPCSAGINRRAILHNHGVGLGQSAWGVYDPTLTVIRIESAAGTLANIIHYGAHPTVLHRESRAISRDWPGLMIDRVEQLTGATTLYFNGAVGDIAPRTNSGGAVGDHTEAALWEAGAVAGLDAMRAWRRIKDLRDLPLGHHAATYDLPLRPLTPLAEAQAKLLEYTPRKDEPGTGMCEYKHWQAVVAEHANPPRSGKPYRQVITALGPLAFVPFPGEPFGETVLRLRERSPYQHTLAISTACGNNAYFYTRESIHRGGYEVWVNKAMGPYLLADGIDDALIDANLALLHHLHPQMHPPLA